MAFAALSLSGCALAIGLSDYHDACPDGTIVDGPDSPCPTTSVTGTGPSVSGSGVTSSVTSASNGSTSASGSSNSTGTGVVDCGALTNCGGSCFDLQTAPENCNMCDHSCGGGMCMGGVCQPDTLATGVTTLHALGVDSTNVYFTADEFVRSCAKAGQCSGAALTTLADFTGQNYDGTGGLAVTEAIIAFIAGVSGHPHVGTCPLPGCGNPATVGSSINGYDDGMAIGVQGTTQTIYAYDEGGGLLGSTCNNDTGCTSFTNRQSHSLSNPPLAATGTHYYYQQKSGTVLGGVVRCAATQIPCTTVESISSASSGLARLVPTATQLFIMWAGGQGGGSAIGYCPIDGCPSAGLPTIVRSSISTFADMTADGDEVFWVDADKIRTCTTASCAAPKDLATGLTSPKNLVTDDKFVYWIEGANGANGIIRRVAR